MKILRRLIPIILTAIGMNLPAQSYQLLKGSTYLTDTTLIINKEAVLNLHNFVLDSKYTENRLDACLRREDKLVLVWQETMVGREILVDLHKNQQQQIANLNQRLELTDEEMERLEKENKKLRRKSFLNGVVAGAVVALVVVVVVE